MIKETLLHMQQAWLNHKKILALALFMGCAAASLAQAKPDAKKPAPVFSAIRQPDAVDIREKLVTLALQNPNYEIADRNVSIAEYNVKKAKGSWLNPIILQGNLNQFSIQKTTTVPGTVAPGSLYPKYNIGANIPLDVFSMKKNDVKIARENLSIAQAQKNQRFREIKADVLTKYEDYLLTQQRLDFQTQVTQDARTVYLTSEKDFQEGAIKQEEYNKSYRAYLDEKAKQLECDRNFKVMKLQMEEIIGISMEDLMKK